MQPSDKDPLIGKRIDVRSAGGILYSGIVLSIRRDGSGGEIFELETGHRPSYRRFVQVKNRAAQIRALD
jgi:hypothetical protein